jgi:hypothetical protein
MAERLIAAHLDVEAVELVSTSQRQLVERTGRRR